MFKSALNLSVGTRPLTPELHHQTPRRTPCLSVAASQIINEIEAKLQAPEALVVKSVSSSEALPTSVPSQLQALADLLPQAQAAPVGLLFSVWARLQVQSPAGRWSG
jgi:hypothetical protein